MQVIAIDYRDTTADACALHPDSPARPFKPLLTLSPGETAHTSFSLEHRIFHARYSMPRGALPDNQCEPASERYRA
jgi:hypothetical protein